MQLQHLVVINVNDSYGNAYVEGMRNARDIYAPDMIIHQIPLDEGDKAIESAIASAKATGYNFVFAIVFTIPTHDALLTEAYHQGVAGDGVHNWVFGDSFLGTLDGRQFEPGSPLHLAYRYVCDERDCLLAVTVHFELSISNHTRLTLSCFGALLQWCRTLGDFGRCHRLSGI